MNKLIATILFFFSLNLFATEFENLKYQIPFKNWKLDKEVKDKRNNLRLYCPKNSKNLDFFGINIWTPKSNILKQKRDNLRIAINGLKETYPNSKITFTILEDSPSSLSLEHKVTTDNSQTYGIYKIITNKDEIICIMYGTDSLSSFDEQKEKWIEAIKGTYIESGNSAT